MGRVPLLGLWPTLGLLAVCRAAWAQPVPDDIAAQRARIQQQRQAVESRHAQALRDCEGRFALTACQDEAKATRRHQLEQLRHAQADLDDAWRRQRAKARLEAIEAKTRAAAAGDKPRPGDAAQGLDTMVLPGSAAAGGQPRVASGTAAAAAPASADLATSRPPVRQPRTRQVVRVPPGAEPAASAAPGASGDQPAASPARPTERARPAGPAADGSRPTPRPDRRSQDEQNRAAFERRQAEAEAHARALRERNAAQDARRAPAASLPLPVAASPASAAAQAAPAASAAVRR